MSSNYDLEPTNTPPWWPGLLGLLFIVAFWMAYLFVRY